jgi:hypothetical protein
MMSLPWSVLNTIGSSPLVRATAIVPLIGYFIVFNAHVQNFLDILIRSPGDSAHTWIFPIFESQVRMILVYYGLVMVGIGSFLFQLFCPSSIRRHRHASDFTKEQAELDTPSKRNFTWDQIRSHPVRDSKLVSEKIDMILRHVNLSRQHFNNKDVYAGVLQKVGPDFSFDLYSTFYELEDWRNPVIRTTIMVLFLIGFITLLAPSIDIFASTIEIILTKIL